jgi:hypothetical protein
MHIISRQPRAVTLFSRLGPPVRFASLPAAQRELGLRWIGQNVRAEFRTFEHTTWFTGTHIHRTRPSSRVLHAEAHYLHAQYVMRDDFGVIVTTRDFYLLAEAAREAAYPYYSLQSVYARFWNGVGSVPGVRKIRGGRHSYRRVRHMNARRGAETFAEDGEVAPRAARNVHGLPQPYDDYRVAARENRNWKRHRKTQWKPQRV